MKSLEENKSMGVGSHIAVLVKMFNETTGPILELGAGTFSTPLLHWLCQDSKRKLVTYETDEQYFTDEIAQYQTDFHDVRLIDSCLNVPNTDHWGFVFVDHHPNLERKESAKRFIDIADFVILHDALPRWDFKYRYSEIFPTFKYKKIFDQYYPPTAVVSNKYEIK